MADIFTAHIVSAKDRSQVLSKQKQEKECNTDVSS